MSDNSDCESDGALPATTDEKSLIKNNELLCYVQNYYNKGQQRQLTQVLSSFYSKDELNNAKDMLQTLAEKSLNDYAKLGRKKKKTQEAEEIIAIWDKLDNAKVDMPSFCAINLNRLPTNNSNSLPDVEIITKLLKEIKLDVSQIKTTQEVPFIPQPHSKDLQKPTSRPTLAQPAQLNTQTQNYETQLDKPVLAVGNNVITDDWHTVQRNKSWASQMNDVPKTAFSNIKPQVTYKPNRLVVRGARPLKDCQIKTAPKKGHLFVGRLQLDTTEEELVSYLNERGVQEVVCRKLKGTDSNGRSYKSAAFMVTYEGKQSDLVHDCDIWPEGATVREWKFKPKNGQKEPSSRTDDAEPPESQNETSDAASNAVTASSVAEKQEINLR